MGRQDLNVLSNIQWVWRLLLSKDSIRMECTFWNRGARYARTESDLESIQAGPRNTPTFLAESSDLHLFVTKVFVPTHVTDDDAPRIAMEMGIVQL